MSAAEHATGQHATHTTRMEPLTQAAAALALSRLSLAPMYRRPVVLFLVAALLPDLDLLSSIFGAESYLKFHFWLDDADDPAERRYVSSGSHSLS